LFAVVVGVADFKNPLVADKARVDPGLVGNLRTAGLLARLGPLLGQLGGLLLLCRRLAGLAARLGQLMPFADKAVDQLLFHLERLSQLSGFPLRRLHVTAKLAQHGELFSLLGGLGFQLGLLAPQLLDQARLLAALLGVHLGQILYGYRGQLAERDLRRGRFGIQQAAVGEACALNWSDVNLATGTLTVRESKTVAGEGREVDLPIGLREELTTWRARSPRTHQGDPVFVTRARNGHNARQTARNVQARLRKAVKLANEKLTEQGIEPMGKITPHSLRRTYASLRAALRDDPIYIAEQLGHRDARFTFRVYQRAAKRRAKLSGRYLEAFDAALQWALTGTSADSEAMQFDPSELVEGPQTASESQNRNTPGA
jgi:hypothetical protein